MYYIKKNYAMSIIMRQFRKTTLNLIRHSHILFLVVIITTDNL